MSVPFPYVNVAELTPFFMDTAPGLFAWRQMAGEDLLTFPDLGGGDLDVEQRREGLERQLELRRPQTALALFWSVVALEDLFRDMGSQLSAIPDLGAGDLFPNITSVASEWKSGKSRPDEPPYLSFDKLNGCYKSAVGINAVDLDPVRITRLDDLVQLRIVIAHQGGLVRRPDLARFKHYQVQAGRVINPPVAFVRETRGFVYDVGSAYLRNLQHRIFEVIIAARGVPDPVNPPGWVKDVVRAFHYFGNLLIVDPQPMLTTPEEQQLRQVAAAKKSEEELLRKCLEGLPRTS